MVRRTFWLMKVVPTWKKFEKRCSRPPKPLFVHSKKFIKKLFTAVTHIESVVLVRPAHASVRARNFYISSWLLWLSGWYCAVLMRIQWTFTAWVESLNTRDGGQGENRFRRKPEYINLAWPSAHWSPFVRCFVCNKFEVECIHSSDDTEQTINQLHYLTLPKRDST